MDAGDYTVHIDLPHKSILNNFKVVLDEECELRVACVQCGFRFLPHEWAKLCANESRISPDRQALHQKKGATIAVETDDDDDSDENAGNYNVS